MTKVDTQSEFNKNKPIIYKVQLRNGFSERNKIESPNTIMQIDDLDSRTRYKILDNIKFIFTVIQKCYDQGTRDNFKFTRFYNRLLRDVFLEEINYNITRYDDSWFCETYIRPVILFDRYNNVFDLVEYIIQTLSEMYLSEEDNTLFENINKTFRLEFVGYRFVNKKITPISDELEIEAIKEANNSDYHVVNKHLRKAIEYFSNRDNPDYDNSIKESISAVEAICQIVTNNNKATLGEALKQLEKNGIIIPKAMLSAFSSLYGYTSEDNGIRHANGIGEKDSSNEEAKFMLISCSAFINFIVSKLSH